MHSASELSVGEALAVVPVNHPLLKRQGVRCNPEGHSGRPGSGRCHPRRRSIFVKLERVLNVAPLLKFSQSNRRNHAILAINSQNRVGWA